MNQILDVTLQILDIAGEMSPYLLLGFLFAGLMHAFIPSAVYNRYLSNGSFSSVLYAALFGVPLPLCSCGVIPTAMSLRREGASQCATVSFLIATPQTGIDSIIATYSLMGLPFAIVRPVAALCTALFGGQAVNMVCGRDSCSQSGNCASPAPAAESSRQPLLARLKEAARYAFVEMMGDIGKWLVVGLVVAGLITVLVPDSFFAIFRGNTLLSMILVLAIAIPMYVCATGSIPIAVALMMKGLTPGAALVLLMAGPACNVASILVVGKVLGRKPLTAYLASIILGSVAFGFGIDCLLPADWFVPTLHTASCHHGAGGMSWFHIVSTAALALLLANALIQHYRHPHSHDQNGDACTCQTDARITFVIKGMNCSHCRNSALKALTTLPGVTAADVDLATGQAYIEGEATLQQATEAITALGFAVEP